MKKLKKLSVTDIDEQLNTNLEFLEEAKQLEKTNFYNENNVSLETRHCGNGEDCTSIAYAYALKEDYDNAKKYFKLACEFKIKPFEMAHNPKYEHYVGEKIREGVRSVNAIDGFNLAMCIGELDQAKQFCDIYQYTESDDFGDSAYRYIMSLKALFNGDAKKAAQHCQKNLDEYIKRPSKGITYRSNYYTLHLALFGILTGDQAMFDDGITKQLQICHQDAITGEWAGMVESRISEFSVALTNLALVQGLKQTIFDDFIPQGLIMTAG